MLIHSKKWNHPWDEYSLAGSGRIQQDPKFAAVQQTIVVQMLLIPWLAAQVEKRRSSHFQSIAGSNVGQIIVMGCDRNYPQLQFVAADGFQRYHISISTKAAGLVALHMMFFFHHLT